MGKASPSSQRSTRTNYRYKTKSRVAKKKRTNYRIVPKRRHGNRRTHYQNVKVEGIGGQVTYFKAKNELKFPQIWKSIAPQYWYTNASERFTVTPGVQKVTQMGIFDAYAGSGFDDDLNNMFTAVNNNLSTTGTTANNKTARFLVESCTANYIITNQDIGNVVINIYDICTKRDTKYDPAAAWMQGGKDESTTGTLDISTLVGNTPQTSRMFRDYFKVMQKTRVVLGSGQCHSHYIRLTPNKFFDGELLNSTIASANTSFRGLTFWTLIVAHGSAYNDVTTKTQVSTGSVALDIVKTKQLSYKFMVSNQMRYGGTSSLPAAFTVNENVMNTGGTTVALDAQA